MENYKKPLSPAIDHNRQQLTVINHNSFDDHFDVHQSQFCNFFIGKSVING